jgi:ribosomal protein S18 acetylase RimI-like enzyme
VLQYEPSQYGVKNESVMKTMSGNTRIREAQPSDASNIGRLVILSAQTFLPALFGPEIDKAVEEMARGRGTLFSYEHAWIAEEQGAVHGMLLGYTGTIKAAQDPRTGLALLGVLRAGLIRRLPGLLRTQSTIGVMDRDEFYISNVAVYPAHRGKGIGSLLIERARAEATRTHASRIILDVETDNPDAQRLYERLGFRVVTESPALILAGHAFSFRRMALARDAVHG